MHAVVTGRIRTNPPAGDAVTIDSIEIGEVVGDA